MFFFEWLLGNKAEKLHVWGQFLARRGRWVEALSAFERAVAQDPSAPISWRLDLAEAAEIKRGLSLDAEGNVEEAQRSYAKALKAGDGFWAYDTPRKIAVSLFKPKFVLQFEGNLKSERVLPGRKESSAEARIEHIRALNQMVRIDEALDVLSLVRANAKNAWQVSYLDHLEAAILHNRDWLIKHYPAFAPERRQDIGSVGNCTLTLKRRRGTRIHRIEARGRHVSIVFLFVNDRIVKALNANNPDEAQRGEEAVFRFQLSASLVKALPGQARLALGSPQGIFSTGSRAHEVWLRTKGSQGNLFELLSDGYVINKLGRVHEDYSRNLQWQRDILGAYAEFREYFKGRFGYDLFIAYGLLLGLTREGNFIKSDDDLDVAYFSSRTSVEAVKDELIGICRQMSADGWTISTNTGGRMFRVGVRGFELDCFAGWEESGRVWMHDTTSFVGGKEVFFPLRAMDFRGVEIWLPNMPEKFIAYVYGPDWRTPDPGYRPPNRPSEIKAHLAKGRLTKSEHARLIAQGVLH